MLRPHNYQHQLNQARKAGLNAREINSAQAGQPPVENRSTQTDANGFVWFIDERGHRTCRVGDEPAE